MLMRELEQAPGAKTGTQGTATPAVATSAAPSPLTTEQLKAQIAQAAGQIRDQVIQVRNIERAQRGLPGTTQAGDLSWLDVPPRAQNLAEEFLAAIVVVVLVGPILRAVIRRCASFRIRWMRCRSRSSESRRGSGS
jgi:hypothetical protein